MFPDTIQIVKTAKDPRHQNRIKAMQEIYAWSFSSSAELENPKAKETIENLGTINELISKSAPAFPLETINKVDLAILRLATYELVIEQKVPVKVIVDEAVELGKEFGSESSSGFINGALGKLIEDNKL